MQYKLFNTLFYSIFCLGLIIGSLSVHKSAEAFVACNQGYTYTANGCVQTPTCPVGKYFDGNTCKPIQCPAGQTLNGNYCEPIQCPTGQSLNGNYCEPIQCPTGQSLNGNYCEPIQCPAGTQLNGNQCVPIQCPAGTQLNGNQCVPIQCAPNQILQATGCLTISDAYWGCRYTGGFWSVFSNSCRCPSAAPWNGYLCRANNAGGNYSGSSPSNNSQAAQATPSPATVPKPTATPNPTYNTPTSSHISGNSNLSSGSSYDACSIGLVKFNGRCVSHVQKFCLLSPSRLVWANGRCQFKARFH